jgi:RNA polymerase sigma factor (sigma-70 family)
VDFIIKRDFNEIVEENTNFVTAIIRKFVKDPETVKDLTQEIFLKAYMNYERYTEDGKIRAWLAVIANNMLKNHYKAEQYQNSHFVFSPLEYISAELLPFKDMPEDIIIQQDTLGRITKIINTLPENQRNAIIYSYFYDYSDKEIASIQDISLSAVKSAKHFGLEKVKKIMGVDYDADENKKHKLSKFGRYKMIKSYTYNRIFTEHTDLQKDSLIELISPTKKDISDVAKFLKNDNNISFRGRGNEDTIKALINGDFNKIDFYPATRVNDALNVALIDVEYMLISHEDKTDKNKDTLKHLSKIWTMYNVNSYINVDFADVSHIIRGAKALYTGAGEGKGENKRYSVENALSSSPLLANNLDKARGLIVNITSSPDISLDDTDVIMSDIHNKVPDADIIFGIAFDDELVDEMNVTIIASDKNRGRIT